MTDRWRREALAVVRSHMFGTKHSPNVTLQRRVKEIHFVGFVGIALIGQCVCRTSAASAFRGNLATRTAAAQA